MTPDDVVVSGFSAFFPQADNLLQFKEKLYAGVDFVTDDDARWPRGILGIPNRTGKINDLSRFDAQFFGVHAEQASVLDPKIRMLLESTYGAIIDAGYDPATLRGRNVGVFVGASYSENNHAYRGNTEKSGFVMLGSSPAMFSNRISYAFGFHGPSLTVDTACSSTMSALNQAMMSLRTGQCEAAIVGGCSLLLNPFTSLSFNTLGMLSKDGKCNAFDSSGQGFVRSEAVGVFFLQRASLARRVYARVLGVRANSDGYKNEGITFPSSKAQESLLRDTYAEANIDPCTVAYVEAHGTGTKAGDTEELTAVTAFFCQTGRKVPLKIGSIKSNMGHAEAASAVASLAKVIFALETDVIAGNLHFTEAIPGITALTDGRVEVVQTSLPFPGGPVGVSSFGFGGVNGHAILEANPGPHVATLKREKSELPRLVLMYGRNRDSLSTTIDLLMSEGPYPDSVYALLNQVGQPKIDQFPFRGFVLVHVDGSEKKDISEVEQAPFEKRPLWFIFTGMGCQWKGMARQMMVFEVFSNSIRKSHDLLKQFDVDLIDVLSDTEASVDGLISTAVAIAAVQVALVDMLRAVGIQPDGFVGHSIGEIGCAYVDGALTAEQTMMCAYWRGRCTEAVDLPKGAMAAVGLTREQAAPRCRDGVEIACYNAEDSLTVSGPIDAVAKLVEELRAENVFAKEVDSLDVAFHSSHVRAVEAPLIDALRKVIPDSKPRSERWVTSSVPDSHRESPLAQKCSAEYYANNFISPVRFHEALQQAPKDGVFIEVAPHCLLQAILRRTLGPAATCLGLMKRNADNPTFFLDTLGKLHTLGYALNLSPLYPPVPWPVPRGTPNISHLVSWDHSQKWPVPAWNEFPWARETDHVVELDVAANDGDAYLTGHQIDGRVLLPASSYLVLAWKSLTKCFSKPFHQISVVFEDVVLHRATVLPKSGPVRLLVNVMRASNEFEVHEAGELIATGRIRTAKQGERLQDNEVPATTSESISYELQADDIYKELRLRGFQYSGAFQGILTADLTGCNGKLKWENNWTTFIDSMLQLGILASERGTIQLPVRILACKIDTTVHTQMVNEARCSGMDVHYDSDLNVYTAGGVQVHGIVLKAVSRRPIQQALLLEECRFVPYTDDEETRQQRQASLTEYMSVCSTLARHIVEATRRSGTELASVFDDTNALPHLVLRKFLDHPTEEHGLLRLLIDILDMLPNSSVAPEVIIKSALAAQKEAVEKDIINTALLNEETLRQHLDVVIENSSLKKVKVLEIVPPNAKLTLATSVRSLLPLFNPLIKIDYSAVLEPTDSVALRGIPQATRTVIWDPASTTTSAHPPADLVIAPCFSADPSGIEDFVKKLCCHCNERGFVLLAYRTALTPAEELLCTLGDAWLRCHATDRLKSLFSAHGFCVIGLKSNNLSSLLLLRRSSLERPGAKNEIIRVGKASFDWLETLKESVEESHRSPSLESITWLLGEDAGISGVVGLTTSLRLETGDSRIRCILDSSLEGPSDVLDFHPNDPKYKEVMERALVMNVYRNGQWGSYRHYTGKFRAFPTTKTDMAYLGMSALGDLSSLEWYASPLRHISHSGTVLCSVYYAPLNFHDIMLATGKLHSQQPSATNAKSDCFLGLEFSGRDLLGRRVMGAVPCHGMATVVPADQAFLWEVPESWSLEEASTVPVAYLTAYYALLVRGNMEAGECVLVHSGSGGVGQAAISIALSMGCTVFTTVATTEKRNFLKRRFPQLQDCHFANSRDVTFEKHVLRQTKGKGVDLVLNSLAEEKLQASVRCLAQGGRFLEIGEFDLSTNSALGLSAFYNNVTFHGIQLLALFSEDPEKSRGKQRVAELLQRGIISGAVRPLNTNLFPREKAEEAFRLMASGKHVGKVIVEMRPEEEPPATRPASSLKVEAVPRTYFYDHKSYVIAGGLGGFGLELVDWMVARGSRKLVLSSRSGGRTGYQRLCLHRWKRTGATVVVSNADISTEHGAGQILLEATALGPVGGVFNLAMVLRDALVENQTVEDFRTVFNPKAQGTLWLDKLSRELCPALDHFVVFSSVSTNRGNVGQTNYGYANSIVERICERRAANGLPGLAIQWGVVGDVGMVYNTAGPNAELCGTVPQSIDSCLAVMDTFLSQRHPVVSSIVNADPSFSPVDTSSKRDVAQFVLRILGVKCPSSVNPNSCLGDLGLDSLVGVEVKQILERECDVVLSMQQVRDMTIKRLVEISGGSVDRLSGTQNKERP